MKGMQHEMTMLLYFVLMQSMHHHEQIQQLKKKDFKNTWGENGAQH